MNVINPKKYFKRSLDMSSDIFSSEAPVYLPTRRSVDREYIKQTSDAAGNYKEPPSHEFYDIINNK